MPAPGKLVAALLIPCFLYLAWIAGKWGVADVYARPAILTLVKWKRGEVRLGEQDWQDIQSRFSRALQLDPDNPELLQWMGTAVAGRYSSYFTNSLEGNKARREAIRYYQSSIRLQPTWPYAWNELANAKFRLGEIDLEYFGAVRKAVALGPWEIAIQTDIVGMGVVLWPELPEAERPLFEKLMGDSLNHGNRNHAMRMLKLLSRTKRLKDISAKYPRLVIDGILRHLPGAGRQTVKDLLVILNENNLWTKLSPEDDRVLQEAVTRATENANQKYIQEMDGLLENSR